MNSQADLFAVRPVRDIPARCGDCVNLNGDWCNPVNGGWGERRQPEQAPCGTGWAFGKKQLRAALYGKGGE